jgi:Flp pilus assembly protein TadD
LSAWADVHLQPVRGLAKLWLSLALALLVGCGSPASQALARAERAMAEGDCSAAVTVLEEAVPSGETDTAFWTALGRARDCSGDLDGALDALTRAIELTPNEADLYYLRANVHGSRGAYYRAFKDFDQAIERNPAHAPAYYGRGLSYASMGRLDRARGDLQRALELATDEAMRDRARRALETLE